MGVHERNRELERQLEEAQAEITRLKDEKTSLKDDLEDIAGGSVNRLREKRDQYRRERDDLAAAFVSFDEAVRNSVIREHDTLRQLELLKADAKANGYVPFLIQIVIGGLMANINQYNEVRDTQITPLIEAGEAKLHHDLDIGRELIRIASIYEFAGRMIAIIRGVMNDPRVVCPQIMASLDQTNTVSQKLVAKMPEAFFKRDLHPSTTPGTLTVGLIQAHRAISGREYDDDISERQIRNYKGWYQTVRDVADGSFMAQV